MKTYIEYSEIDNRYHVKVVKEISIVNGLVFGSENEGLLHASIMNTGLRAMENQDRIETIVENAVPCSDCETIFNLYGVKIKSNCGKNCDCISD